MKKCRTGIHVSCNCGKYFRLTILMQVKSPSVKQLNSGIFYPGEGHIGARLRYSAKYTKRLLLTFSNSLTHFQPTWLLLSHPPADFTPRCRDPSARPLPAYQAASLHSGEQPVWSLSRPRGLNSTLQTGWLIFMSFGRCSRSLALPGNYPADQSTARAAPRLPSSVAVLFARPAVGPQMLREGGQKRCSVVARQAGVEATLAAAEVCLRSIFAPCKHVYQFGRPVKKRPRCPSRAASVVGAAYCAVRRPPAFLLYDSCDAQGIRLVEICMFSIFIPFLHFCRHTSLFVGVSPRRILSCQG